MDNGETLMEVLKMDMEYSPEVETINKRIFTKRLDQNYNYFAHGWTMLDFKDFRPMKSRDKIKSLLESGYKVTGGFYCTSVRGYHLYYILYKSKI